MGDVDGENTPPPSGALERADGKEDVVLSLILVGDRSHFGFFHAQ